MVPSKVTMCMHCSFTGGNEITNLETESRSRWLLDHDTAARPADLLAFVLAVRCIFAPTLSALLCELWFIVMEVAYAIVKLMFGHARGGMLVSACVPCVGGGTVQPGTPLSVG